MAGHDSTSHVYSLAHSGSEQAGHFQYFCSSKFILTLCSKYYYLSQVGGISERQICILLDIMGGDCQFKFQRKILLAAQKDFLIVI
jgi:hypothetical protein